MSLIVADVGGTNARLAFQKNINSEIILIENFLCSEFKSLEDIITTYKKKHGIFNKYLSIGVAGPCEDDNVLLSNNHIKFNKIELLKNLKLKSLLVINDFVAQSFVFKDLLLEKNEEKYKTLLEEHENLSKKLEDLKNKEKLEERKQIEFSEKIDELNQETDTLLDEIDKWQM